jgi:hypothetical protein
LEEEACCQKTNYLIHLLYLYLLYLLCFTVNEFVRSTLVGGGVLPEDEFSAVRAKLRLHEPESKVSLCVCVCMCVSV